MPHVIVKLWPGKSEEQKTRLAEEITKDVMDVLHYGEEPVSVAIEEIEPQDWAEKVYTPEILTSPEKLRRNQDTQCEKELNMNISFENKVALVTGAGSGLGLATAKAFAESGASVVLADWNEQAVRSPPRNWLPKVTKHSRSVAT